MNPPFENKFGCLQIVLNVLNNVKEGTKCAFILPDKKLEKASKNQKEHLLQNNRIEKIIKLPTNIFKQNTETSIFIITAGVPQNDKDIYTCYIEDDGLETLKNQGRHDINNKWRDELEAYWLDFIEKNTIKEDISAWIKPSEHLSFQTKQPEFEIFEEDFRKTIFEYYCFQNGIDVKKYKEELVDKILYSSIIKKENNKSIVEIDDEILQSSKHCGKKIDTTTWKEFDLKDLFEISGSKTTSKQTLNRIGIGKYPYITTQATTNGINGYYNFYTEQGDCLTIDSAVLGTCFYQQENFSASDHVEILRPKFEWNKYIALFLANMLNQTGIFIYHYSYLLKRSQKQLKRETIPLPTAQQGEPDWQFMEDYIKSLPYGNKI